jgi:hypothetical protein
MGESAEYALAPPRRVTRSQRGEGMAEYQVRVTPAPPRHVRDAYNETKPPGIGHPRLRPNGFVLYCPEGDDIARRLDFIQDHALPRLAEITIDLRGETAEITFDSSECAPMCPECTDTPEFLPPIHRTERSVTRCPRCGTQFVARGEAVHRVDA